MRRFFASTSAWVAMASLVAGFLVLDLVAAVPNSPTVPPLLAGAGPARWMVRSATALGLDGLGRGALTAIALVLVAVLLAAWAVLLREAWRSRVGAGPVAVAAIAAIALAVIAPVLLSRDVYSYAAYGRMAALHHASPYVSAPSAFPADPFTSITSSQWRDTRSVYGPVFTLISEGVVRADRSPPAEVLGLKIVAGLGILLAAGFATAAAARTARVPPAFAAAAVALNPVLVVHTVGGGHNDALVAAGVAAALYLFVRAGEESVATRPAAAFGITALLTVSALIKAPAVIALGIWIWWLSRRQERPAEVALWHVGVALALAAAATAPYFAGWRSISALVSVAGRQGWASPARLVARGADAIGNSVAASAGAALRTAVFALFLAAFAWALVRVLRSRPDDLPSQWGAALLLFALAAPYLLPWYAAWFVPMLPLLADRRLVVVGLAAAGGLALTGIPAEPAASPHLWRGMIVAVHYVVAPAMLVLLFVAVRTVMNRSAGPVPGAMRPTLSGGESVIDARP